MYHFVSGQWIEKGSGVIKLNTIVDANGDDVQEASADDHENGNGGEHGIKLQAARFIMRAAATHKVILNARIFKEMSIADAAGNEPKGKSLVFSVPVEGKLVPHTLKVPSFILLFTRARLTFFPDGPRWCDTRVIPTCEAATERDVAL